MNEDDARRRIAELLDRDEAARAAGIRLRSVRDGTVTIEMTARTAMGNGHGIVHGGWLFLLADTAAAYALAIGADEGVTMSADIVFHAPATVGGVLTAVANETHRNGANGLYDVAVHASDGRRVASARLVGRGRRSS